MTPKPMRQSHIDWLLSHGVTIEAMCWPEAMLWCGERKAFYFPDDDAYWNPHAIRIEGHFCLGADNIIAPENYIFDGALQIHESPLAWLKANRSGIVVIDWSRCFDQLRDCPRLQIPRSLMPLYKKHMRVPRVPEVRLAA